MVAMATTVDRCCPGSPEKYSLRGATDTKRQEAFTMCYNKAINTDHP